MFESYTYLPASPCLYYNWSGDKLVHQHCLTELSFTMTRPWSCQNLLRELREADRTLQTCLSQFVSCCPSMLNDRQELEICERLSFDQAFQPLWPQWFGNHSDHMEYWKGSACLINCVQICLHWKGSLLSIQSHGSLCSLRRHCRPQLYIFGLKPYEWRQYCNVWMLVGG